MPLIPLTHGSPSACDDPDRHLVVARVGGLVAEQDQVGRLGLRPDRRHDRRRRGLRIPFRAVGDQVDRLVDADRHHVPQLLLGLRRTEGQHGRGATVLLDQPHRLLGPALFVRADREAEVPGRDRPLVVGEHDLASRQGDALDAHEDVHERTRELSGSNSDVESAEPTVTG